MSKQEKSSPRAMPVETIITRFKSKQKLLEHNKKNTSKFTGNIIKKANKQEKANKKRGRPKKIVTVTQEEKEIHPKFEKKIVNKINLEKKTVKKIVLAPKHCYTLIGSIKSCNKRKLHTPRKEISCMNEEEKETRTKKQEPDMFKLMEDCGSLDEEDLLEILTCPSPVWWEDPPDGYIEEPIFSNPQPQYEQKSIKTQLLEEQNKEENQVSKVELSSKKVDNSIPLEINVVNRDSTFINKRSKLELLLGNIKNRNHVNKNTKNIKNKKKLKAKRKKAKKENFNPINKSKNEKNYKIDNDKRCDSLSLSELGDDEILNNLENIDIPMDNEMHKDDDDIQKYDDDIHKDDDDIHEDVDDKHKDDNDKHKDDDGIHKDDDGIHNDDDDHMSAEYLDMSLFDDEFDIRNGDIAEEVHDKANAELLTHEMNDNDIAEQVIDKTNNDLLTNEMNDNDIAENVNDNANDDDLLTNEINDNDITEEIIDKTNDDLITNENNDNDMAEKVIDITNDGLLTNEINYDDRAEKVIDITNDDLLTNEINYDDIAEEIIDITDDELATHEVNDNNKVEVVIDITDDDLLKKEVNDNDIAEEVIEITDDDLLTNAVIDIDKTEKLNDKTQEVNDKADDDLLTDKVDDKFVKVNDKAKEINDKVEEANDTGDDLLTVYKVIDNDPNKLQIIIPKTGNDKIDNYYKHMKKINKIKDKSIMISEADAIRYCFVCSSIFDTKSCGYCDKKKEYSCDICGINVNAKSEMITHLKNHINGVNTNTVCNDK